MQKIWLVISPVDMRCGWRVLSAKAAAFLNIDVNQGKDLVVFISKTGKICKVIGADKKGTYVLSRRLHEGSFQRLAARVQGSGAEPLNIQELEMYLDGEKIQEKRTRISCI